ncbi:MAG: STAS domain-containing protein [Calditrichaeota bacterium]|nr:STAS domain-containing protein [Calditrichota bacterium]
MEIQIDVSRDDSVVVFTILDKEVNRSNSASLKEKIFVEIAEGNNKIILDLKNVAEMDSSGLGALLFGKRQASNSEGNILLVSVNPAIQSLLRIAQLNRVFDTFESVEDARKNFAK